MTRRKPRQVEHVIQCAVIASCKTLERQYPELKYIMAIPNGGARGGGRMVHSKKHKRMIPLQAVRLKQEGVKPGVPDLFLPVPIPSRFAGLWLETKAPGESVTPNQKDFMQFLSGVGFKTMVYYSAQEAVDAIKEYMQTRAHVLAAIPENSVFLKRQAD